MVAEVEGVRDSSLYSGSAAYYAEGRVAYPSALADRLTDELRLDGSGRLLDVGCGPGSLTLMLAEKFEGQPGSTPTRTCSAKPTASRPGPE